MEAKIYKADGTIVPVSPKNGKDFKCEELQEIVGGYFEIASANIKGRIIVCNEEGKLKGMDVNKKASLMLLTYPFDFIAGDALICPSYMVR